MLRRRSKFSTVNRWFRQASPLPQTTPCASKRLRLRLRPSESFPSLRTMDSSLGHCFGSRKASRSQWTCSMTPIRQSNCTGMVRRSRPTWTEPPRRERHLFLRMASGVLCLHPDRQACASITLTTAPAQISRLDSTADKWGRCTSSRDRNRADTTAKSFLS